MTKMNYQVTWYGQVVSRVVASKGEAERLKEIEIDVYKKNFDVGWVSTFDPEAAVEIICTTKRVGSW